MKQYDISISREQMAGLLSEENVFGDMVREVINQVLQAQMVSTLVRTNTSVTTTELACVMAIAHGS